MLSPIFLTGKDVKFLSTILPTRDDSLTKTEQHDLQSINLKIDKWLLKNGEAIRNGTL